MSLFFRCLNPPTMASHLRALLMLLWWVYILLYIPRLLNEILILSLRMELIETQVLYEECNQVKSKSRSQQISAFISTFQVGNLRFAQTLQLVWSIGFNWKIYVWICRMSCTRLQNFGSTLETSRWPLSFSALCDQFAGYWSEFCCKLTNLGDPSDWPR